ncbi:MULTISPECIES: MurR/RpiR family transcriptional regulator [Virgibacillus]|uniref:DNA-binding transcriptional regulator, MurR/RpiR family, contains HTH and SIS domains n=1 Tax=Virgibacillus chiguensis TaxID=411959 RepID=A0A1M5R8L0_9BACI|nr:MULTISPECIES: MurR/RpiR family transcriptional regulator [Virgibacillus]SHH22677.1 DNA-binding transcriptional regulator, MurR/RpiR family, contains HTH and SIS domains [Virgibacillus chiguensis]
MDQVNQHGLARIRSNYSRLSEKEKKIADYILQHPKAIIHHTINQIADELEVADSTVFRFCQRVGFKGYQALKIALAAEMATPVTDIHEKIRAGDDVGTVSEKVFRSNMNTLEDTLKVMDQKALYDAVAALIVAEKVEFFGIGGSAIVSIDAYHKFLRSGMQVHANLDAHMQLMAASQLSAKDVAVIISHSGSTKDIMDILHVLRDKNVTIIAITNFAKSTLSKQADILLYTVSDETEFRPEALSSRIAELTIIDALYTNVMLAKGESAQQALQDMRKAIALKRL